jgi:hypothetical protein
MKCTKLGAGVPALQLQDQDATALSQRTADAVSPVLRAGGTRSSSTSSKWCTRCSRGAVSKSLVQFWRLAAGDFPPHFFRRIKKSTDSAVEVEAQSTATALRASASSPLQTGAEAEPQDMCQAPHGG